MAVRDDSQLILRPSRAAVFRSTAMVAGAAVFLGAAGLHTIYYVQPDPGAMAVLAFLPACLMGLLSLWSLCLGRVPLVVQQTGQVKHGRRQLCAAGSVRRIEVHEKCGSPDEPDSYDVCIATHGGRLVKLPAYYAGFSTREEADELGQEISGLLGVNCVHRTEGA